MKHSKLALLTSIIAISLCGCTHDQGAAAEKQFFDEIPKNVDQDTIDQIHFGLHFANVGLSYVNDLKKAEDSQVTMAWAANNIWADIFPTRAGYPLINMPDSLKPGFFVVPRVCGNRFVLQFVPTAIATKERYRVTLDPVH